MWSRLLRWWHRRTDNDQLVRLWVELDDGTTWHTPRPLPLYDAELILYGLGHELVPTFLIRVIGDRRVVKASLMFKGKHL